MPYAHTLKKQITRPYDEGEEYDKKLDNLLNKIESFSRIRTKRIHLLVAYYFLGEELKKSIDPKQTWNLFAKERKRKNARYDYKAADRIFQLFQQVGMDQIYHTSSLSAHIIYKLNKKDFDFLLEDAKSFQDMAKDIEL
ncbi:5898_t:CDS:2 [Entrophospora sp. SA101]|nr:5898_t:CDS:2 [Entrophospora sp. SA101]